MRHPDLDLLFETERRKDEMRAAEHARLLREAIGVRQPRFSFGQAALTLSRALAFLGQLMLDWSARLQCHYRGLASPENQPEPCA